MAWWMAIPAATKAVYKGNKWVKQMKKLKKGGGSTVKKIQSGKSATQKAKAEQAMKKGKEKPSQTPDYKAMTKRGYSLVDEDIKIREAAKRFQSHKDKAGWTHRHGWDPYLKNIKRNGK